MGRPAIEITEELCNQARELASKGLTLEQIATSLGMGESTVYRKKGEFSEFREAIEGGQAQGIATVTNSLFERANGYSHPEEKIFCQDGEIIRAKTIKHYPPDVTAQKHYLNNRAGWSDKSEVENKGLPPINKIKVEFVRPPKREE